MKIGLLNMGGAAWTGGVTYLKNLSFALKNAGPTGLKLALVSGEDEPPQHISYLQSGFDEVIRFKEFGTRKLSPAFLLRLAAYLIYGHDVINASRTSRACQASGVSVLFGCGLSKKLKIPTLGWFPDFQHVDIPATYSRSERVLRDRLVAHMGRNCTLVVFSSHHAKGIFERLHPRHAAKARVLHFVAHLPLDLMTRPPDYVVEKFKIGRKFFFLPNQFWEHKNHLNVFKAMKLLRQQEMELELVCSGNMSNRHNPHHKDMLMDYLKQNDLANCVRLLGFVDFADVYGLMRQACAVINPSLYEGWSTTVEEAKTLGKPLLLSNIEVHREQDPAEAVFFDPQDPRDIAATMQAAWMKYPAGPYFQLEDTARRIYPQRLATFANEFIAICEEAIRQP